MTADRAVLYVEDEPVLRELVAMILEDAGFEVVTAENGVAAFHALDLGDLIDQLLKGE